MNQDHVLSSGSRPSIHAAGPHGTFVARLSTPASANEYCASMQHGDLSSSNAELQCDLGGEVTQLVGVEDRPLVLYE